jgi:hypothetical protein
MCALLSWFQHDVLYRDCHLTLCHALPCLLAACLSGSVARLDGSCEICGRGFYAPAQAASCLPCDPGSSTPADGASSKDQCNGTCRRLCGRLEFVL